MVVEPTHPLDAVPCIMKPLLELPPTVPLNLAAVVVVLYKYESDPLIFVIAHPLSPTLLLSEALLLNVTASKFLAVVEDGVIVGVGFTVKLTVLLPTYVDSQLLLFSAKT